MTEPTPTNPDHLDHSNQRTLYQTAKRALNLLHEPQQNYTSNQGSGERHSTATAKQKPYGHAANSADTAMSPHQTNYALLSGAPSDNVKTPTPALGIPLSDELTVPKHDMYKDPWMPDRRLTNTDYLEEPRTSRETYNTQQPEKNKI